MKKKRLILILSLVGLIILLGTYIIKSLLPDRPIYYRYNNNVITRLDKINGKAESRFFYGYYDGRSMPYPKSYIKVTYHGIDGSMSLDLVFCNNKKAEIITGDGWFEKIGEDTNLVMRKYSTKDGSLDIKLSNWVDSNKLKCHNVAILYDDIPSEKRANALIFSHVKATYAQ